MNLPRSGDPLWPAHVRASLAEGFCPNHRDRALWDQDDGWWYCLLLDTYWSMDGQEETAEDRERRTG